MMLHLTDLSNEPLHRQLTRQLRWQILSGRLAEGSVLPAARTLAREERLSAGSVERAYADLTVQGLVVADGGDDHRVAPISSEQKRELERARLLETMRERELSIKELELARDIQCRLLPPPEIEGEGFRIAARNEPARFVAGDFYDVIQHANGEIGLVVADVAGKGLGPSLLMASVKAVMPFIAAERSVEEALGELNAKLSRELGAREFVALTYARFDPRTGRVRLANAGLPDPYHLRPGHPPRALVTPEPRLPLGLRAELVYRSLELVLEPGERLLWVTDGLPEARIAGGELLGYDGLERRLAETTAAAPMSPGDFLDAFLWRVAGPAEVFPEDDRTAVVLERSTLEAGRG